MSKVIGKILDQNIFECAYDAFKGKNHLSSIEREGIIFRFSNWLNENDISDDTPHDVYNNTSEVRDGNRFDIHDNYEIFGTDLEISYIYSVNGTVWAVLYDSENDRYYGEMEILPI